MLKTGNSREMRAIRNMILILRSVAVAKQGLSGIGC
jgi:hypothetical protein